MMTFFDLVRGTSAFTWPLGEMGRYDADDRGTADKAWSRVVDELLRIRKLEDDWDGQGGEAPHPALVDGAITLSQRLQGAKVIPPERVHAGVNGTVFFEWHTPLGYWEIEVLSPVEAECRSVPKGASVAEAYQADKARFVPIKLMLAEIASRPENIVRSPDPETESN